MKADVVIIGSGPAGTATALFLEQHGIRPIIVEKEMFPRFHIGESLTGECGKALGQLGFGEQMTQRSYFVKRGVNVYSPTGQDAFHIPVMGRDSAGLYPASTWHVRRSDFDKLLYDTTIERGAKHVRGQAVAPCRTADGTIRGISVRTEDGKVQEIAAKVVVDASGASTFLSSCGVTSKKERGNYTNQVAIFSHMVGVDTSDPASENTLIFYQKKNHWGWLIPLNEGVTSIGVVVPTTYFTACQESKQDFFMREIRELNPQLASRTADAARIGEVRAVSNYSYHIKQFVGDGFVCVGDSHRFIDPIFSFGLHFSVAEGRMAAQAIAQHLDSPSTSSPFAEYQMRAESGQDVIQALIDAFWNHPLGFGYLAHVQHVEDMIDLFAGRIYLDKPSAGLLAIRTLAAKKSSTVA